ncbi:TniQ family protein [Celeribacter halophilus]|uniref:TniQ family protein n=1 Tax=Celeribacter halophilus TaxID=576117 RepID=UPI002FD4C980
MTLSLTVPLADMEPVSSFLSRIALRNLCDRASSFCADVGLNFSGAIKGEVDQIERIADLGGVSAQTLLQYSVQKKDRFRVSVAGETFSKQTFQRSVVRVCPSCVKEGLSHAPWMPARHLSWKLSSIHTCMKHQQRLIRLPSERFTVSGQDFSQMITRHKSYILNEAADPKSSTATEFEEWIVDRLRNGAGEAWIDSIPLAATMRTAEVLGTLLRFGPEVRFSALDVLQQHEAGQAGFRILQRGKPALHDLLNDMVPQNNILRKNYSKVYGGFYVWLADQKSNTDLAPIAAIMRDVIVQNYPVRSGTNILGEPTGEQHKFSLHGVRGNFDIGPKRLRDELLARGLAEENPHWEYNVVLSRPLDRALLEEISQSIKEHVDLYEAASRLGLSEQLFRKLVYEGLIPRRAYRDHRHHQYDPVFLDRFLASVTQGAALVDTIPEGHVLALRAGQVVGARSSEILHLLATHQIPCVGLLSGKTGLSGAIVELAALKNAAKSMPMIGFTYCETHKKLRVSTPTLRYLLKLGFLSFYRGKNPTSLKETEIIPQVSVDAFLEKYISLAMLSEKYERPWSEISRLLRHSGVTDILRRPKCSAIYRRKEAEEVLDHLRHM